MTTSRMVVAVAVVEAGWGWGVRIIVAYETTTSADATNPKVKTTKLSSQTHGTTKHTAQVS